MGSRYPQDPAHCRVALAVDAVAPADDDELSRRHLVERQGAGLVRADRGRRSQCLHGAEAFDDRALLGQLLRAERQQGRDHRGKTGGDRRDRQADADEEQLVEVLTSDQPDDDDEHECGRGHDRDQHGQLVELLGERSLFLLDAREHPGDVADFGRHPGRGDDHLAPPARDLGVHVGHVDPVAERDVLAVDRVDDLGHRGALAGETGLFDLERGRHEDASVGRNLVPRFEADDVSGDELLRRYLHPLAVAADVGIHDQHLAERGDALRRLALLVQPHNRVQHREADHDQSGRHLLQRDDADDCRSDQHQLHEVLVLTQERLPGRLFGLFRELVRPVPRAPGFHLRRG